MKYSADIVERFKWPVPVSRRIDARPQKIWSAITKPANLNDCHPFCEKNPVYEWPGVGSYDLLIGREGGKKSFVSWRITEEQNDAGRLRITIYPYILQSTPILIRWIPYKTVIQPALHSYLESVLKGFEWFITTGKPVSKNQCGSHRWFSSKDG